jgi:predicted NUDIX family NTP pyrophosphohydrolase
MSDKTSAGILLYQIRNNRLEVFVAHPGGPYLKNKDEGVWSIPKGEVEAEEDLLSTAVREFSEETGISLSGDFIPLGYVKQRGGKTVYAWACQYHEKEVPRITSNECEIEWPPRSGKKIKIPEIDRAEFFDADTAREKINPAQAEFIDRLKKHLDRD